MKFGSDFCLASINRIFPVYIDSCLVLQGTEGRIDILIKHCSITYNYDRGMVSF